MRPGRASSPEPGAGPPTDRRAAGPVGAQAGLLVVVVVWGANFSVVKDGLATLDPLVFNAARFVLAGLALTVLGFGRPTRLPHRRDLLPLAALGLVGHMAYQLGFIFGLDATLAGNAAIILAAAPIWTVALAVLLGQDTSSPGIWASAALGLVGILLVMAGGTAEVALGAEHLRGDLLVAGSSVCWAVYTVTGKGLVGRYGALAVTTWAMLIGGVPIVLAGIPGALTTDWGGVGPLVWAEVAFAGLGAVALAYVLWYRAVAHLGSSLTALWSNLVPCVALGVAWAWLGERPSLMQITGALVVVASVLLARKSAPPGSRKALRRVPLRSGRVGRS